MKIGDTVTFNYFGGSNYGLTRKVQLTAETEKTWSGIDLSVNEVRKYFKTKMGNAKVVKQTAAFDEAKALLESLFKSGAYSYQTKCSLVKDFNTKWNVSYEVKNDKLTLKPVLKTMTEEFTVTKDLKSGIISFTPNSYKKVRICKDGSVYVNGIYSGCSASLYQAFDF